MKVGTLEDWLLGVLCTTGSCWPSYAPRIAWELRKLGLAMLGRDGQLYPTAKGREVRRHMAELKHRDAVRRNGYRPTPDELALIRRAIEIGEPFDYSPTIKHLADRGIFDYRRSDEKWHLTAHGRLVYELRSQEE